MIGEIDWDGLFSTAARLVVQTGRLPLVVVPIIDALLSARKPNSEVTYWYKRNEDMYTALKAIAQECYDEIDLEQSKKSAVVGDMCLEFKNGSVIFFRKEKP